MTWGEYDDLTALQDDPIRFRFTLDDGSLYAFWVSPDASGASYGYVGGGGPGIPGPIDTVGQEEDTTAPTPDPMTWASVPSADSESAISMTATTATDPSGVSYFFDETSDNPGGDDSGWVGVSYTDDDLSQSTEYSYQVKARDNSANKNETDWSTPLAYATTDSGPLFEDGFDVSEWNGVWTEDAQNDWFRTTSHQHADDGPASACVDGRATDATLTTVDNIDVSGSSTVTVDCWWWIDSGLDTGEYLRCEYKLDAGSWTPLDSLDGNVDTENHWHPLQLDVNTSDKSNMLLRFKGKMSRSNEDAYVDTVKVTHKN